VQTTLILPGLQHGVRPRIESVARAAGLALSNVIEINSIAILKSAILADMGATILPSAPVLDELERGAMRAHRIHSPAGFAHCCFVRIEEYSADQCGGGGEPAGAAGQRAIVRRQTWPGATVA
jgi:LysR family nitrogen assimilation transcriptional regulator